MAFLLQTDFKSPVILNSLSHIVLKLFFNCQKLSVDQVDQSGRAGKGGRSTRVRQLQCESDAAIQRSNFEGSVLGFTKRIKSE